MDAGTPDDADVQNLPRDVRGAPEDCLRRTLLGGAPGGLRPGARGVLLASLGAASRRTLVGNRLGDGVRCLPLGGPVRKARGVQPRRPGVGSVRLAVSGRRRVLPRTRARRARPRAPRPSRGVERSVVPVSGSKAPRTGKGLGGALSRNLPSMSAAIETPFGLFIGGQQVPAADGRRATLLNPATNQPLAVTAVGGVEDARHALEVASRAFRESGWAAGDGAQRTKALFRLARLLEERAPAFAEGETIPVPGARFDYTVREPLGVTVHIAPWNYPLLLAVRSIAPALAAGNAVVLKPASLTPLTALRFAGLAHEAGIPDGILNVVVGDGRAVGEALLTDSRCASVSFTGSSEVGRRIAELAAPRMIPTVLELGGKSPVVVFPDADLERAARAIATGIFQNSGQMCWAGSRLVVEAGVEAALLEKLKAVDRKSTRLN